MLYFSGKLKNSLAIGLIVLTTACGFLNKGKRVGSASNIVPPVEGPSNLMPQSGMTVAVHPFQLADKGPNVHIAWAPFQEPPIWQGLHVVPGFHWEWIPPAVTQLQWKKDSSESWVDAPTLSRDEKIPADVHYLRYYTELKSKFVSRNWPAVLGFADTTALSTGIPSFLHLLPADLAETVKIIFYKNNAELLENIIGEAEKCGTGCVTFSQYAAALDAPLTVFKDDPNVENIFGKDQKLQLIMSARASENVPALNNEKVGKVFSKLNEIFRHLSNSWGDFSQNKNYTFHLLQSDGCRYQGLEHHYGSLLSLGTSCEKELHYANFLKLASHELVHAWNAKRVFALEAGIYTPLKFSKDRLKSLYLYEGMTEGFSRIALGQFESDLLPYKVRLDKWNESSLNIRQASSSATIESVSQESPSIGYEVGALLTLRLASLLNAEFGEAEAKSRFWQFMVHLAQPKNKNTFDVLLPSWTHFVFNQSTASMNNAAAQGYSRSDIESAFSETLGSQKFEVLKSEFFSDSPLFLNKDNWNGIVKEIAQICSLNTIFLQDSLMVFDTRSDFIGDKKCWFL